MAAAKQRAHRLGKIIFYLSSSMMLGPPVGKLQASLAHDTKPYNCD